ncbi:MAG: DEAD/DEAH box helicase, partial [Deltaproteobacteria bacterium]|nr:DEAD/DEAH box helicase [Deltaproteobacteria bacterium]
MLNPITYTEHVVADFLRYQMTTYALADRALRAQLRTLLNLDQTRDTPLLKGPYFSLSKTFRRGTSLQDLGREGILHPHVANIAGHAHAYGHQESAFRAIAAGKTTVVSTGTGSGKTEAFLYPVISQCLRLRDHNAAAGICAVIVYPMNALAEDQLGRLRDLLAGTGVTFGMYVGKTPRERREVSGERLRQGASRAEYRQKVAALQARNDARAVHPPEERASREEMRTPGQQPRILLTNVKQLELLLTRQQDAELFDGALLDFLIFDEAHTFSGAIGAETACLIRRLRSYCGKGERDTVSVATSATIADRTGGNAGRDFAVRFFGVPPDQVELVREDYEPDHWQARRVANGLLAGDPIEHRQAVFQALERADHDGASDEERTRLVQALEAATGIRCRPDAWQLDLHAAMSASETAWQLSDTLDKPRPLGELLVELQRRLGRPIGEEEVLIWLALGAAARREQRPLLRPVVHAFVRGIDGAVVTFPAGRAPRLWLSAAQAEADRDPHFRLPILSCTTCGQHYFEHHVAGFDFTGNQPGGGEARGGHTVWPPLPPGENASRLLLLDRLAIDELDDDDDGTATSAPRRTAPIGFCKHCGALQNQTAQACLGCGRPGSVVGLLAVRQNSNRPGKLSSCIGCGALGGERMGRWRDPARPLRATAVADVHVLAQNMLHYAERRRLLVFADNRQDAAFQAGWMRDHARHYRLRSIIHEQLMVRTHTVGDLVAALDDLLDRDDELSRTLAPEVWSVHRKEELGRAHQGERRKFLRVQVLREITTGARQTIGLEPWGRMRVDYAGLEGAGNFHATWAPRLGCTSADLSLWVACLLDTERRKRIVWDAELKLFSRTWSEADALVSSGFTAGLDLHVRGLKVQRDPGDRKDWVAQWQSSRGMTLARQLLAKLAGSAQVDEGAFFRDLW